MQRMLITGGAGFIGSNFVHYTLTHHLEYKISVVDNLSYAGNIQNISPILDKIHFITADICDKRVMDELISENDIIVHFAAESHNDRSLRDPWPFIQSNLVGTATILEAVRKHDKRFHHISTDEVFGDTGLDTTLRFNELSPYRPTSPYSATKAGSDLLVKAWIHSYNIRATMSNCSNNFGPCQHVEKFIPREITRLLSGLPATINGGGDQVRDWIHVDDHSAAVHAILERGKIGEHYVVGASAERSVKEVVQIILDYLGKSPDDYIYTNDRPTDDQRYAIDSSKLQRDTGWKPEKTDFVAAIQETIDWYRNNVDWWRSDDSSLKKRGRKKGVF